MENKLWLPSWLLFITVVTLLACKDNRQQGVRVDSSKLELKRGEVIVCGPGKSQFGRVSFPLSCPGTAREDFNLAMALLHSFEYDEAEKVFARVIDKEPGCAMAYWGVALSNYHLLWSPPTPPELEKGAQAIGIARKMAANSATELEYINAASSLYDNWKNTDHITRCLNYEKAMEKMYLKNKDDKETAVLYALALVAAADPADSGFLKQRKAGAILDALYTQNPDHPGVVHYIIHTYDNPKLAGLALTAARRYASLAPSSAHALHMPSHIFTRLGHWDESIQANIQSVTSAKCYAEQAGIPGHWDEELHGLDYLMYAYLQKADLDNSRKQLEYLRSIKFISPVNFKVSYAFASIPSRYVLENKLWKEAAALEVVTANFDWKDYPWQKAIIHFTRAIGAARSSDLANAKEEIAKLAVLRDTLLGLKDAYKAKQVDIQVKTAQAWVALKEGRNSEAVGLMTLAADREDQMQKHPVTPGEVIPARELLAEMYLEMNKPAEALRAFELDLEKHPNRFNALFGAGLAAEKMKDTAKAAVYFNRLILIAAATNSQRAEVAYAREFVSKTIPQNGTL